MTPALLLAAFHWEDPAALVRFASRRGVRRMRQPSGDAAEGEVFLPISVDNDHDADFRQFGARVLSLRYAKE